MHGMIQRVKEWLSGKGYKHYIVERRGRGCGESLFSYYQSYAVSAIDHASSFRG